MDSAQIIKRRLAQLKRMSIQLKQSTQNSREVDFNIVYGILQATKSSASKLSQMSKSQQKVNIREDSPLTKLLAMNSPVVQPYRALFPQNGNGEDDHSRARINSKGPYIKIRHQHNISEQYPGQDIYFGNSSQQQDEFIGSLGPHYSQQSQQNHIHSINNNAYSEQNDQQIISLREQNTKLQKTMLSMRHQIIDLKQKLTTVKSEQEWKAGLPFFRLNQKIQAFYTRMKINQNDYHKIDYVSYDAELSLDRLAIKKSAGVGNVKELDIAELKEVHYIDSIAIFLHFGVMGLEDKSNRNTHKESDRHSKTSGQDFFENLFIKFKNQEELHRWDLALYINFKIIESLKKDKLFATSFGRSRSKSRKRSTQSRHYHDSAKKSKRSSDNILEDDQDLMKKLVERRDLYLQTKKMVSQRMIQKVNQKKGLYGSGIHKNPKDIQDEEADEFSQTHPFQLKDEQQPKPKSKFNYIVTPDDREDNEQSKQERANTSKFKDLAKPNYNIQNIQNVVIPNLNLESIQSNQRGLSFNPNQQDLSLSRKLQQERIQQANEQKRQEQQKKQRIQQIIKKFTQQGYDLTKYSKDGFNPHDKRVFLSDDLSKLCWEQDGGKNKKYIQIKDIREVQLEKIGQGVRKHIKKPKKQQYCIISYIKDNKVKVIELGANSTVMAQFAQQLLILMQHLKSKK